MSISPFAIRAINTCRLLHKPTYVAFRAMLDYDIDPNHSQRLIQSVQHRLDKRKEWRYYSFPVLKEIVAGADPKYRDFLIGSPLTLLAESLVLSEMAKNAAFHPQPCVYSYWWPKHDTSGHNYSFYRYGYSVRNSRIARLLKDNPDHVAVINDIKKYYPSISWNKVQPKVDEKLRLLTDAKTRNMVASFIEGFKYASKSSGLGVGPDISHVIGNIALENVDVLFTQKYGERYFRYVDDIIVVCHPNDVQKVQNQLSQAIAAEGLTLNDNKVDCVDSKTWLNECPPMARHPLPGSFEELVRDLQLFLVVQPDQDKQLRAAFVENGFSLPFDRFVAQCNYGPFKWHVRRLRFLFNKRAWNVRTRGIKGLVSQALQVRTLYRERFFELVSKNNPTTGMQHRWHIQNIRYHLNRLLYLQNRESYGDILSHLPAFDEMSQYRLLLTSLCDGNPMRLLGLPGNTVATFCEIANEYHLANQPQIWPAISQRAHSESATMLSLYFNWQIPNESKVGMYKGSRILLDIVDGHAAQVQPIAHQSFLDEIELLLREVSPEARQHYLRSRCSDDEDLGLSALSLGDGYAS